MTKKQNYVFELHFSIPETEFLFISRQTILATENYGYKSKKLNEPKFSPATELFLSEYCTTSFKSPRENVPIP